MSCGGNGGVNSTGVSPVTISATFVKSDISKSLLQASTLTLIRYTVSGSGMNIMTGTVPVTGNFVEFILDVPNGPQRHFLIEALDNDNTVTYTGEASRDLDGTPMTVEITLVPVTPPVNVTGMWSGTITRTGTWSGTPDSECLGDSANITYVLSQSGNTVTGTYSFNNGLSTSIFSGFLSGNTLSITTYPQQLASDDCHLYSLTFVYTVTETTMTLTSASGTMCCGDGLGGHVALFNVTGGSGTLNKVPPPFVNASINGLYYGALFNINPGGTTSSIEQLNFDGMGNVTVSQIYGEASGANQTKTLTGTYSVNADGTFTVTDGTAIIEGRLSDDAKTFVTARVNSTTAQNIGVGVKQ
jgi:hypothetical protein